MRSFRRIPQAVSHAVPADRYRAQVTTVASGHRKATWGKGASSRSGRRSRRRGPRWALLLALGLGAVGAGTAQASVVINEIDYDQPGTDTGEYIELRNDGAAAVSLDGYSLRLVNGADNSVYRTITLPTGVTLAAGGYYVICGDAAVVPSCNLDVSPNTDLIQNGSPDALSLLLNGVVVDSLSYEGDVPGNVEGTGVPTASAETNASPNLALSRCPDGVDSDNNAADFKTATPTPGLANACGSSGGSVGSCGAPATRISAIQGAGAASPLLGQTVNVEAVVTGDFQANDLNGFFVQEEDGDADADPATSEGLFVFEGALAIPVAAGNLVRVRGTVAEFNGSTELTGTTDVVVCPGTPVASATPIAFPVAAVSDLERLEGMRVTIAQTLTVTGNFGWGRFGSLDLSAAGRLFQPTNVVAPGAPALALQDTNTRNRILLDDLSDVQNPNPIPYKDPSGTRRLGDTVPGLTGVLGGAFSDYRIYPTQAVTFTAGNPRPVAPPAVGGRLRIAALNVLNFFTTLDTGALTCGPTGGLGCRGANTALELDRQREKLLNELEGLNPDVAGLMELENNASASIQSLVDGLNARLGAGTFAFIDTGTIGTDAIKVGLIYKVATVQPVHPFAILTSAVNPAFIDTKNRPSLAQTFAERATSARFTVVVNHLKSKGSDCVDVGDPDRNDGQGNCNGTRNAAAAALLTWIASDPTASGDPDYLVIGDLNAYAMEDPIRTLKAGGLQSLIETHIGSAAYSYQFSWQSGYLDHALATPSLAGQVTGVGEWHINADEPVVENYNLEFKTDDPFDVTVPDGASDHDPLVVGLSPAAAAAVPALGALATAVLAMGLLGGALFVHRRRRPDR